MLEGSIVADKVRQLVTGGELIETKRIKRPRKPKEFGGQTLYEDEEVIIDELFGDKNPVTNKPLVNKKTGFRTGDWIDDLVESVSKIPPRVVNTETVIESIIDSPFEEVVDEHVVEAKVNTESTELQVLNHDGQFVIDSRDVAEMIGKRHTDLLRTISGYKEILDQNAKLRSADFFIESSYKNENNQQYPCYLLTKKGCDMVANKMTGAKGVLFTATYVTRFEEMENQLKTQTQPVLVASYMIDNPIERAKQWIEEQQEKMMLEEILVEQVKVIEFKDEVIEEKVQIIEGLTDELPVASQRQMIVTVLRQGCVGNYLVMAERWAYLYSEFNKVYHMNVKVKMFFQQKDKMKLANLNHGLIIERATKERNFYPLFNLLLFP